jgi:manganese transport protein
MFILPLVLATGGLLLYITFRPLFKVKIKKIPDSPHGEFHPVHPVEVKPYIRIAVAIDFSKLDAINISNAISQGGKNAEYLLVHVVESAGALIMKNEIRDSEFISDEKNLARYAEGMNASGYKTVIKIGYGNPKKAIPLIVTAFKADLLVMGAHGHKGFKDFIFGATVDAVRHKVKIPVLIVRRKATGDN